MFLTRLGFGSKMVVTGDITQVDLPFGNAAASGSSEEILDGLEDVHFSMLTSQDVVRHKLVGEIVDAYDALRRHSAPTSMLGERRHGTTTREHRGRQRVRRRGRRRVDCHRGWPASCLSGCGSTRWPSCHSCCVDDDEMAELNKLWMD